MSKKILITGKNSYIGSSFSTWMAEHEPESNCTSISVRGQEWREYDFSGFDTVLHVTGIAHKKMRKSNQDNYFKINHELAVQVAMKAKENKVANFVFLSTMSVFGKTTGHIDKTTTKAPSNNYGLSKLKAENDLMKMSDSDFIVSIVRPPMVYGEGCKGNYNLLEKAAKVLPVFPNINNKRSMIDIEYLCSRLYDIMNNHGGYYHPQDPTYSCTTDIVRKLARKHGRYIYFTKCFNYPLKNFNIPLFKKIFGNLTYDLEIDVDDLEMKKGGIYE